MARILRLSRRDDISNQLRAHAEPGFWRSLWSAPWERLAMLVAFLSMAYVGGFTLSALVNPGATLEARAMRVEVLTVPGETRFSSCTGATRVTCVVDGDTIWLDGTKIRIADIDTPEVSNPSCAGELALGQKATARLIDLLNAGPFDVLPYERDTDVYGRKLRILSRDGRSLGDALVDEGLARVWDGSRHGWCA